MVMVAGIDRETQTPASWHIRIPRRMPPTTRLNNKKKDSGSFLKYAIPAVVAGGVSVLAVPVVLGAVGFTSAGIAAGAASPDHYAADTEHSIPLSHIIQTLSTPVLPLSIIAERQAGGEKSANFSVRDTPPSQDVGSLAAKMMSMVAIANGGGVAAGGVVATLQSVGAAGLGAAGTMATAGVGAAAGAGGSHLVQNLFRDDDEGSPDDHTDEDEKEDGNRPRGDIGDKSTQTDW